MYCGQQLKTISCRPRELERRKLFSLFHIGRRYGGEAKQCAAIQACGQLCVLCATAGRSLAREGKTLRESLDILCLPWQAPGRMGSVIELLHKLQLQGWCSLEYSLVQATFLSERRSGRKETSLNLGTCWLLFHHGCKALHNILNSSGKPCQKYTKQELSHCPNEDNVGSVLSGNPKYLNLAQFALTAVLVIAQKEKQTKINPPLNFVESRATLAQSKLFLLISPRWNVPCSLFRQL